MSDKCEKIGEMVAEYVKLSLSPPQRSLCVGESDKLSCFVFEMLLCLHVVVLLDVVFKMLSHV